MSLRRAVNTVRDFSSSTRVWAYTSQAEFGQNGDPGPNATKFRKSQRKALKEGKTHAIGGLDALNGLLDPGPPSRDDRPSRPSRERETRTNERRAPEGRTLERRGPRSFQYTGKTVSAPDAYGTSLRLRKITQTKSGTMTLADLDRAIKMVMESPRSEVSTPVWNMLLGTIGREGRLELMWKTFNDMKKRGCKPTSRTYTTLLNAYAGLRHAGDTTDRRGPKTPEPRTTSRVSIIHDQAHSYLVAQAAELERLENQDDPDELGLGTNAIIDHDNVDDEAVDVNIGPTNAYLKFLAKYGMMQEMEKVFSGMPTSGPLSPDSITYSTMFSALFDKISKRSRESDIEGPPSSSKGLTAGGLWNQAYRQFRDSDSRPSEKRQIDEDLALIALKCMSRGDQTSQRQAMQVIDALWPLPRPSDTRKPTQLRLSSQTQTATPIPHLPLTIRAATTIMAVSPKPTDRSHYAHLFLQKPELQKSIDTPFLITAIRVFSETGDVQAVIELLNSYQPRQPNQWPLPVWHDALTAARWSLSEEQGMKNQPDFEAALAIFRRMTHLPPGVEEGEITGPYLDNSPNGQAVDSLGVKWAKTGPVDPDAKAMSLFIKTALSRGWRDVQRAMAVFLHLDGTKLLDLEATKAVDRNSRPGSGMGTRQWGVDLCRDVERACERLLEKDVPGDEKAKFEQLLNLVKRPEQRDVENREARRPVRSARFSGSH